MKHHKLILTVCAVVLLFNTYGISSTEDVAEYSYLSGTNFITKEVVQLTYPIKDLEYKMIDGAVLEAEQAIEQQQDAIVQETIEPSTVEYYEEPTYTEPTGIEPINTVDTWESSTSGYDYAFMQAGVVYGSDGTRYTWYSQNVLPGGGLTELNEKGYVCDGDGYIAVASSDHPKGTIIETPFGTAKVYDTGCASGTIDVYTDF